MFARSPFILSLLFAIAITNAVSFGQKVKRSDVPAWVQEVEIPAPSQNAEGLAEYLLLDFQTRVEEKSQAEFMHVALRVLNEQGVQAESQLTVDFDPSFQTVALHRVAIHRDGRRLDQLDMDRVQVIQRETELSAYQYLGSQTAMLFLEDVRVGDVIELAYTRHGASPVFEGRYFDVFTAQFPVAVRKWQQRLIAPPNKTLTVESRLAQCEPVQGSWQGNQVWTWERINLPRVQVEPDSPSWWNPYPRIEVTEYSDWNQVALWGSGLFDATHERGDDLRQLGQAIRNEVSEPHERLLHALRFVQREIRYLGIQLGEGAHRPTKPNLVLKRRYGDCKDKAALLIALLDELGIEARPVLVHSQLLHTVRDHIASPMAFDHVIVKAEVGAHTIWVDPTLDQGDGPLNENALAPFGFGLVLDPESNALTEIKPEIGMESRTHIAKMVTVAPDGSATMNLKTIYKGADAHWARQSLAAVDTQELTATCLEYIQSEYPTATVVQPARVSSDTSGGRVIVTEQYRIANAFDHQHEGERCSWVRFSPSELVGALQRPSHATRTSPFGIAYPHFVSYHIVANFPTDYQVQPVRKEIKNSAFHFFQSVASTGKRVEFRYEYRALNDHVLPQDLPQYLADLERVDAELAYEFPPVEASGVALSMTDEKVQWMGAGVLGFLGLLLLTLRRKRNNKTSQGVPLSGHNSVQWRPMAHYGHQAPQDPYPPGPLQTGWQDDGSSGRAVPSSQAHQTFEQPWNQPAATALMDSAPQVASTDATSMSALMHGGYAATTQRPTQAFEAPALVRREQNQVVMLPGGALPGRCVRCNQPCTIVRTQTMRWHHPGLYWLILAGILIYAVVAVCVTKKQAVQLGYCGRHDRSRKIWSTANGLAFAGGVLLVALGQGDAMMVLGGVLLFGALVSVALSNGKRVRPKYIGDTIMRLHGFHRAFLDSIGR